MPDHSATPLSRRAAIGLLISAGVLPAIPGAVPGGAARAHAAPSTPRTLPSPLGDLDKPGLRWTTLGAIQGPNHRVRFHRAQWADADGVDRVAVVRDIEVRIGSRWLTVSGPEDRFDEQWVLHTGDQSVLGAGWYGGAEHHWLAPHEITFPSRTVAELTAVAPGVAAMTIRWDVSGDNPELQWSLTAQRGGNVVVGYWAGNAMTDDRAAEVLCGSLQHARVIGSEVALLSWELFAPMALVQTDVAGTTLTSGVYIPAEVLEYEHPRMGYWDDQPFGMSLRTRRDRVQTAVYAPPGGRRSVVRAGQRIGYAFGLAVQPAPLYETQVSLSRKEFGFTRYRRNVYGQSMTDTVHNIIDLVSVEPDGDDSVDFVPSVSGWWDRGKGFCNIEAEQTVRTATSSVLLSANLLATTGEVARTFWNRRARPYVEHLVSRRTQGYSPKPGWTGGYPLCGNGVGNVNTIAPLVDLMQGRAGGVDHVAITSLGKNWTDGRVEFSEALGAYQLTDDPGWLAEAVALAKRHVRDRIDTPYTTNIGTGNFGFAGVKAWLELLVLYDITGDEEFLRASHREAKRYMGMFHLRPVPSGTITSPVGAPIDDQWYKWVTQPGIPEYPRQVPPTETVEAWEVSPTGLTFEQLSTYLHASNSPGGGFTLNPIWAPFLTRLADLVDDDFLRDMADAMVVGRFTNYPGYYHRQFVSWPAHPRFPVEGPPGTSAIYYHHAPAQLGLAIDHLVTEHVTRSNGRISFPYSFECVFVYFKYHVYGHAPGEFFGDTGVWPFFPRGIVTVSNPQLNWLTGVSERAFHVSVSNASAETQRGRITFDPALTGIEVSRTHQVQVHDANGTRTATLSGGVIDVSVPPHGLVAVSIPGAGRLQPWHVASERPDRSPVSYHFDDFDAGGGESNGTTTDRAYAMLLPRPDRTGYEAYLQCSAAHTSTVAVRYRIGDGAWQDAPDKVFPYEWSVPVDDLGAAFGYQVTVDDKVRPERRLWLPGTVTGALPEGQVAGGDLSARGSTTPTDPVAVTARIRTGVEIAEATLEVVVPTGWTSDQRSVPLGALSVDAVREVTWTMTPTAQVTLGIRTLQAKLRWIAVDGASGEQALTPTNISVAAPLRLVDVVAPRLRSWGPDDPVTVTTAIVNRGPVARTGTMVLTLPAGWRVESGNLDWTAPARGLAEVVVRLAPDTAGPGSSGELLLDPGAGLAVQKLTLGVLDPRDQVVVPGDEGYAELGTWLRSGLAGYAGSATRYSPDDVHGGQVEWSATIREAGRYEVSVWYPTNPTTTSDARYVVGTPAGPVEHHVDQQAGAREWRVLGSYDYGAQDRAAVTLTAITGTHTRVNAARFRKVT